MHRYLLIILNLFFHAIASAEAIDLRDYILLTEGMSEAEVLYRLGPYDHEAIYSDGHHGYLRKVWYYIPDGHYSGEWITEITFDGRGKIRDLNRFKPRP